jgi:hypothetical protein
MEASESPNELAMGDVSKLGDFAKILIRKCRI